MVHAPGADLGEKEKFLLGFLTCCADYSWLPFLPAELISWQSLSVLVHILLLYCTGLGLFLYCE